jgi:hypothetical protein
MLTNLSELPVELFHAIIDQVPTTQERRVILRNLRLSCRTMQMKTRVLFGQEHFSQLLVLAKPQGRPKLLGYILLDEIFRHSITRIHICVVDDDARSWNLNDWEVAYQSVLERVFKAGFRRLMQRAPRIAELTMSSPEVQSEATDSIRALIDVFWSTLVGDILSVVFTTPGLRLTYLGIGSQWGTSTPLKVLTDIPKDSMKVSELKVLRLDNAREEMSTQSSSASESSAPAQTFGDFLTLLPKIEKIYYHSVQPASTYPVLSYISDRPPKPPTLSSLALLNISTTETALVEGLQGLCSTLRGLTLGDVKLTSGTWRPVFGFLHRGLSLGYVHLHDLTTTENEHVLFDAIVRDRPLVLHSRVSRSLGMDWFQAIYASVLSAPGSPGYQALKKEVDRLVADECVWVSHHSPWTYEVQLVMKDGDDVGMWLKMLEEKHEVEEL